MVATSWADLIDGTLAHAIDLDEAGDPNGGTTRVWTGTYEDGTRHSFRCSDWDQAENATESGRYGWLSAMADGWSSAGSSDCVEKYHVYCFEQ